MCRVWGCVRVCGGVWGCGGVCVPCVWSRLIANCSIVSREWRFNAGPVILYSIWEIRLLCSSWEKCVVSWGGGGGANNTPKYIREHIRENIRETIGIKFGNIQEHIRETLGKHSPTHITRLPHTQSGEEPFLWLPYMYSSTQYTCWIITIVM